MRLGSAARGSYAPAAALLVVCLIVAVPLWGPGMINTRAGGDSPFLLQRTQQMAVNLQDGVFPVRWMPDAAYGLGYPFFSYYAALPFYLSGGLVVLGLDVLSAVKVVQSLFLFAAALAMYAWARRLLAGRPGALLAAAAYTLAPFHLVNLYVRGDSLSEFAAFAFYPLILWALDRLADRPSLRRAVLPALAYAGLVVTHNLSALIFSPFAITYVVVLVLPRAGSDGPGAAQSRPSGAASAGCRLAWSSGALLLGILLSAWYWLPALGEVDQVQLTAQTTGYFHYSNHFRAADLVQTSLLFGYELRADAPSPFAMGLAQAVLLLVAGAVLVARRARSRVAGHDCRADSARWAFVFGGLVLATVCITPLSGLLWDHLPLLEMVQFPWRFLSVQSLFAAVLIGGVINLEGGRGWAVAAALIAILGVAQLGDLRPEYLSISSQEVTVERLQLYEMFTGNIGTTVRHEYLPEDVVPRPYTGAALFEPDGEPRVLAVSGELVGARETERKSTQRSWEVEAGDGGAEVAFPVYYWPGWKAAVDDQRAELRSTKDLGHASLFVPEGGHVVKIWLGRTPLRAGAEATSAAAALLVLAVIVRDVYLRRRYGQGGAEQACASPYAQAVPLGVAVVCVLGMFVLLAPDVSGEANDLTMDFAAMPYLHHNPGGVALGPARLESYAYSSEEIAPGSTITVTLYWDEPVSDTRAELRLVAPGDVRLPARRDFGSAVVSLDDRVATAALQASGAFEPGPGMYLISLSVVQDGAGGQPAEQAYLSPVWVHETMSSDQAEVLPGSGTDLLRLHEGSAARQEGGDSLAVSLLWSTSEPVPANYGLALRLLDSSGSEWIRIDTQPGYGFLATSLWPPGRVIADAYLLQLPLGTPPGEEYSLIVRLYRVSNFEVAGEWALPVALQQATAWPDAPVLARLGNELALSRLEVPDSVQQGEHVALTAYWLALDNLSADYSAEWRLKSTAAEYSYDLPLAAGSPPSSWPAGAYVAGRACLPIGSMAPSGEYELSVTVFDPEGGALEAYVHPVPVSVIQRERQWALPEMDRGMGTRFGDLIELAGYDLTYDGGSVELSLHWRALGSPEQDYTFFVHLADPATGIPLEQIDSLPGGGAYPTGLWVSGEVVSDQVTLSVEGVPRGSYDLAVGWYSAGDMVRLRATDSSGEWLADDRLILPDQVAVP